MSKTSNGQREQTLREWMIKNIKVKNKDAIMYCDPSKRRVVGIHNVYTKHDVEKEESTIVDEIVIPIIPITPLIPSRKIKHMKHD